MCGSWAGDTTANIAQHHITNIRNEEADKIKTWCGILECLNRIYGDVGLENDAFMT